MVPSGVYVCNKRKNNTTDYLRALVDHMYVISKDDGFQTTVLQAAIDNAQFTLCQWYEKYLEHKYTHYNWNRNSRSMTHWKRGHVIYVDAIHKNYRFQNFLLKLSHNVKNKCEALMSLSAIKSLFKIVVLVLWYNVQVTNYSWILLCAMCR